MRDLLLGLGTLLLDELLGSQFGLVELLGLLTLLALLVGNHLARTDMIRIDSIDDKN